MRYLLLILLTISTAFAQKQMLVQYRWGSSTPPAVEDTLNDLSAFSTYFTTRAGAFGQNAGTVYPNSSGNECGAYFTTWDGGNDQHVEVILSGLESGYVAIGAAVRVSTAGDVNYYGIYTSDDVGADRIQLFKVTAGSWSAIGAYSNASSVGDTLKLEIEGTTLKAWLNSTQLYSGTQSDFSTGMPGVAGYGQSGNAHITEFRCYVP